MAKTKTAPAAAGSNVKATDFAVMAKVLNDRVDRDAAIEAAHLAQQGERYGGFVGHLRTAKITAPTIDELLVWTPLRPDDMKPGKNKSNPFNDVMEDIHHAVEPHSSARTLSELAALMNLASHASKSTTVDKAFAECSDVTRHSSTRSKEEDIKTSATALAALQKRKALLDQSNSAQDWQKADVQRALDAVDKPGHLAAFGRELGRRRKERSAYFARMYLAHVGGEIQKTCEVVGSSVGYYWHRAVQAARTAHINYVTAHKSKGTGTTGGLFEAMRLAAHNVIATTEAKKEAAAVTIKPKEKDLRGTDAKRAAVKLAEQIVSALERLKANFPSVYKIDERTHEEMLDAILIASGIKMVGEVAEEVDQNAQEKAQRDADAKAARPGKPAKQASEVKSAKRVEPAPKAPKAPGMPKRAKPSPVETAVAAATIEGDSVLADLDG